ncbi:hypothetical protein HC176_17670, partial [Tamlana crocina]|nr:hypothetical protein [Tamlana crocina]
MTTKPILLFFALGVFTLAITGCKQETSAESPSNEASSPVATENVSNKGQAYIDDE